VKTTVARLLLDLSILPELEQYNIPITDWDIPGVPRRNQIFYMLNTLPEIPKTIPSPKFVYFHIVFPHPPYIVDADGKFLNEEPTDELAAYADHITYLNSRLIEIIDTLLEESDPEPIIVIQGDHGASVDYESLDIEKANRLGILNALHLPGNDDKELYSTISPVNTFRIIFDRYFNGNYGLLLDKSIVGKESQYTSISCSLDSKQ
jgi:arylsulfatase A-like enzyme